MENRLNKQVIGVPKRVEIDRLAKGKSFQCSVGQVSTMKENRTGQDKKNWEPMKVDFSLNELFKKCGA